VSRTSIKGQFAPRTIEMLRSPAYCVLSLSARRVLDRLEIELADHGGNDNGRLPVTYADFHHYGIDRHAIAPAIRELEALGFIEIMQRGRAGNAEFRSPSLYRITYRHCGRNGPTDEWRRIVETEAQLLARAARRASKKQKVSVGKGALSGRKTNTETPEAPVWITPTTVPVGKPTLLSISRVGDADSVRRCYHEPPELAPPSSGVHALVRGQLSAVGCPATR
jgi:hypothetical protein